MYKTKAYSAASATSLLASTQINRRNPTERDGKLVWYSPSVGTEPLLAEVILQRVKEASGS